MDKRQEKLNGKNGKVNFTCCSHNCEQMSTSGFTVCHEQKHEASVGTNTDKLKTEEKSIAWSFCYVQMGGFGDAVQQPCQSQSHSF